MLSQLKLQISPEDETYHLSSQKAVLLQSILMDNISPTYARKMHEMGLHPYSQALVKEGDQWIWLINSLNKASSQELVDPLERSDLVEFNLERDQQKIKILSKCKTQTRHRQLMETFYFGKEDRYVKLLFRTPASFKSEGGYINYPRADLLYKSILQKYDAAAEDETLYSDELIEEMQKVSQIVGYRLRSCRYYIGKGVIPSFLGEITIRIDAAQSMVNFINYVLRFGEYSGVGVKTGMGMGCIQIGGAANDR